MPFLTEPDALAPSLEASAAGYALLDMTFCTAAAYTLISVAMELWCTARAGHLSRRSHRPVSEEMKDMHTVRFVHGYL